MKLPITTGVYTITGPTGWVYVGRSNCIENRWYEHYRLLQNGRHPNSILKMQEDWIQFGVNAFDFNIAFYENTHRNEYDTQQKYKECLYNLRPLINPIAVKDRNHRSDRWWDSNIKPIYVPKYNLSFRSHKEMSNAMGRSDSYVSMNLRNCPHLTIDEIYERGMRIIVKDFNIKE